LKRRKDLPLHVAVDLHARSFFTVGVDIETGEEVFRRRLPVGAEGEASLCARLQPGDTVVVEATTGAHRFANRLDSTGATVRLADPQKAALVGFRGKKTDYRDCLALLEHLRSNTINDVWRPDASTREIRQLTRERRAYNQQTTQLKNRIHALLREEGIPFPGECLWEREGYEWLGRQRLSGRAQRLLRREWGLLRALLCVKETQDAEFQELALQRREELVRLLQIPGFGVDASVMVLGEVGDFSRFATARKLVSYAGLNPRLHQSDQRWRGGPISKAGRSQLRWLMTEIAWAHVIADGPEACHYHRLVARGKPKGVAIIALARRLLVIAFLLLRRSCSYRNQQREQWHRKLTKLASCRLPSDPRPVGEERHTDWAWARYEEVTSETRPERNKGSRSRQDRRLEAATGAHLARGAGEERRRQQREEPAASTVTGAGGAGADSADSTAAPPPAENTKGVRPAAARLAGATRPARLRAKPVTTTA